MTKKNLMSDLRDRKKIYFKDHLMNNNFKNILKIIGNFHGTLSYEKQTKGN